jgi:hypothetical protein
LYDICIDVIVAIVRTDSNEKEKDEALFVFIISKFPTFYFIVENDLLNEIKSFTLFIYNNIDTKEIT